MRSRRFTVAVAVLVGVFVYAGPVQAGLMKNVLHGLALGGFNTRLQRDILQDGYTFDFSRQFFDEDFDFGNTKLTLNGALSGRASFGTRGIPEIEFSVSSTGLTYSLEADTGPDQVTIDSGLLTFDTTFKVNLLGFYELDTEVTNRGDIVSTGPFDGTDNLDFDLGPVRLEGHLLIDLLNGTLGQAFDFGIPGGAPELTLGDVIVNEAALAALEQADQSAANATVIPEPGGLAMMGLTGWAVAASRRRRK